MMMRQDAVRHNSRSEVIVYGGRLLRRASRGQRDVHNTQNSGRASVEIKFKLHHRASGAAVIWEGEEELRFQN